MRRPRVGLDAEDGSGVALGGVGIAAAVLVAVVTIDVGAYLVAAARAQAAADAGALAAVQRAHPRAGMDGDPKTAARVAAAATGVRLLTCDCGRGRTEVSVTVAAEVPALLVTRVAPRTVTARARARLVPPAGARGPPGAGGSP